MSVSHNPRTCNERDTTIASAAHTMGSTKLWLPSLRSVASHLGALSMVFDGHCRLGRFNGLDLLYFLEGSWSLQFDTVSPERHACE